MVTLVEPVEAFVFYIRYSVVRREYKTVGTTSYYRDVVERRILTSYPTLNYRWAVMKMNENLERLKSLYASRLDIFFYVVERRMFTEDHFVNMKEVCAKEDPKYMVAEDIITRTSKGKYCVA